MAGIEQKLEFIALSVNSVEVRKSTTWQLKLMNH